MNTLVDIQTIKGPDGTPAYVVVPYAEFIERFAGADGLIPHDVVSASVFVFNGLQSLDPSLTSPSAVEKRLAGMTSKERVDQTFPQCACNANGRLPRTARNRTIARLL